MNPTCATEEKASIRRISFSNTACIEHTIAPPTVSAPVTKAA
jgi:hypothetical protein